MMGEDTYPGVNTDTDNPFRGGQMLMDSVNSKLSDFPARPAGNLPNIVERNDSSGRVNASDVSPDQTMMINRVEEVIQFYQERDEGQEEQYQDQEDTQNENFLQSQGYNRRGTFQAADSEADDDEEEETGFVINQQTQELQFEQNSPEAISKMVGDEMKSINQPIGQDEEEEEEEREAEFSMN